MFKLPTPNAAAFISPPPRGMGPTGMPSAARYCRCRSSSSSCFCARNSSRAASPLTHGASNVAGRTWPRCTNSLNLGGDAAAAVLVLERRWRTQFSTRMRRHPGASMAKGRRDNWRDGAAKCIDCSTVLTLSAKLNVCNVSRHRWRSSSTHNCGLDARSIVKISVLAFFFVASLREQNVGRGTLFLLKSFASNQSAGAIRRQRDTPPDG